MILRGVSVIVMDSGGDYCSLNEFGGYYRMCAHGEDALDQKRCVRIAVILTPYMMEMYIMMNKSGVELYMSSLPAFGNTSRPRGQNRVEEKILVWFVVDVLGNEPWTIAVR